MKSLVIYVNVKLATDNSAVVRLKVIIYGDGGHGNFLVMLYICKYFSEEK